MAEPGDVMIKVPPRRDREVKLFSTMILAATAAAVLAACGGDDAPEPPQDGTLLEYSRSGGFAFSIYEVTIETDGTGIARFGSDVRELTEKEFELTPAQLEKLRATLEENPIPDLPKPTAGCADCFSYTYAWGGDEVMFDDASIPDELDPVVEVIAELPLPEDGPTGG